MVTLGLFMSAMGRTSISHDSVHSFHIVWSFAQYACETLIFLLTGVIIGVNTLRSEQSTIDFTDWIRCIGLYIFM
jgi:hypothetical protein